MYIVCKFVIVNLLINCKICNCKFVKCTYNKQKERERSQQSIAANMRAVLTINFKNRTEIVSKQINNGQTTIHSVRAQGNRAWDARWMRLTIDLPFTSLFAFCFFHLIFTILWWNADLFLASDLKFYTENVSGIRVRIKKCYVAWFLYLRNFYLLFFYFFIYCNIRL